MCENSTKCNIYYYLFTIPNGKALIKWYFQYMREIIFPNRRPWPSNLYDSKKNNNKNSKSFHHKMSFWFRHCILIRTPGCLFGSCFALDNTFAFMAVDPQVSRDGNLLPVALHVEHKPFEDCHQIRSMGSKYSRSLC